MNQSKSNYLNSCMMSKGISSHFWENKIWFVQLLTYKKSHSACFDVKCFREMADLFSVMVKSTRCMSHLTPLKATHVLDQMVEATLVRKKTANLLFRFPPVLPLSMKHKNSKRRVGSPVIWIANKLCFSTASRSFSEEQTILESTSQWQNDAQVLKKRWNSHLASVSQITWGRKTSRAQQSRTLCSDYLLNKLQMSSQPMCAALVLVLLLLYKNALTP